MFSARSFPLRLISTAARPLVELAREGGFHEELASLLSTITIALVPLCERREDLPLLAQSLVEEANIRGAKQLRGFSSEALDLMDAYAWPGNLDELARVVAEAHQRAEGPEIGAADLPAQIHLAAEAAAHPRRPEETIVLDEYLGRIERELVEPRPGPGQGQQGQGRPAAGNDPAPALSPPGAARAGEGREVAGSRQQKQEKPLAASQPPYGEQVACPATRRSLRWHMTRNRRPRPRGFPRATAPPG